MMHKKIKNKECCLSDAINNIHSITLENNQLLGLWIYLMSDCIMFAIFFAVYAILSCNVSMEFTHNNFFQLPPILLETVFLLLSSLSCGLMTISMMSKKIKNFFLYFFITFCLGVSFLAMEIHEFYDLVRHDLGPSQHAFSSAFFTLIGTHGVHVFFGLIWLLAILCQIIYLGFTRTICLRILCFSLFWHFLDVIWVCVFTFVYLNGAI